jgi:hypothetical protein
MPSRKAASASEQRRNDFQADRARTAAVRDVFPQVGLISIDLDFTDVQRHAPSPQRHSLYPGAVAFFRFSCPCADCDGDFDLTAAVTDLVKVAAAGKRGAGRGTSGGSVCQGVLWRDSERSTPCRMHLNFRLGVTFSRESEDVSGAPA